MRFAGITAMDAVSFTVQPGTIHAVIGPNGAGKSTCFNVVSGVYRPQKGSVKFGSHELTKLRPHQVADIGLARTFQNIALAKTSTVMENIMVGRHHLTRSGMVSNGLRWPSAVREEQKHRARAFEIAEFVGLADRLGMPAGVLSYGDQKRLELARALAMEPKLLMLDEPVAGMGAAETQRMALAIAEVRTALGISVLLVEHDMGMVMALADRVTVLDFGKRIADGTPDEVQKDPAVVRAYLGAADELSGGESSNGTATDFLPPKPDRPSEDAETGTSSQEDA